MSTAQHVQPWRTSSVLRFVVLYQRWRVLAAVLFAMGHQAGEALVPVMVGVVIDRAVVTGDGTALVWWIAVLLVVFVGLSLSFRCYARTVVRALEHAAHALRMRLATRVLDARGGVERDHLPGALLRIGATDTIGAASIIQMIATLAAALAALAVAVVALLRISTLLGLAVVVGAIPVLILMQMLGRPLERRVHTQQRQAAVAAGVATDVIKGLRVVKGIGAEDAAAHRYRRVSRTSLDATLRSASFEAAFTGVATLITGLFLAAIALVAGSLAANGKISVGSLIATVGLAQFLIGPLQRVTASGAMLARSRASAERVAMVLATPTSVDGGEPIDPAEVQGDVQFHHVTSGGLDALDLQVRSGQLLGVVATDPSDARALLDCLARTVDPDAGHVSIDGRPLHELDPDAVHAAILVAAHDAELFEGTVASNIAGGSSAGAALVDEAIRTAGADEVAETLPDRLQSPIGEKGRTLSGGQRQRVALARALAAGPPVLVLHDPTSAVDTVTEARIASGLRRMRAGRTTVVVTTSPTLLAACDRVVVVAGGKATLEGTHLELVDHHGSYRSAVLA